MNDPLREIFNYPYVKDISDESILVAITSPINDPLEYLGDAVLELIVSEMLYDRNLNAGQMSKIRSIVVRNVSLVCLMNDKNLCVKLDKSCADVFEAIIGAVYKHLQSYDMNVIKLMMDWMNHTWRIQELIDYIIKHPDVENLCPAIEDFYSDILLSKTIEFSKLDDLYHYYRLGPIEKVVYHNKVWVVKVKCPLALGCQYYEDKDTKNTYLSIVSHRDKNTAIAMAYQSALKFIYDNYELSW